VTPYLSVASGGHIDSPLPSPVAPSSSRCAPSKYHLSSKFQLFYCLKVGIHPPPPPPPLTTCDAQICEDTENSLHFSFLPPPNMKWSSDFLLLPSLPFVPLFDSSLSPLCKTNTTTMALFLQFTCLSQDLFPISGTQTFDSTKYCNIFFSPSSL